MCQCSSVAQWSSVTNFRITSLLFWLLPIAAQPVGPPVGPLHTGAYLLVKIDVFALLVGFNQLLDDIGNGHHHQLGSAEVT